MKQRILSFFFLLKPLFYTHRHHLACLAATLRRPSAHDKFRVSATHSQGKPLKRHFALTGAHNFITSRRRRGPRSHSCRSRRTLGLHDKDDEQKLASRRGPSPPRDKKVCQAGAGLARDDCSGRSCNLVPCPRALLPARLLGRVLYLRLKTPSCLPVSRLIHFSRNQAASLPPPCRIRVVLAGGRICVLIRK